MDHSDAPLQSTQCAALSSPACSRRSSSHISRKTSWGTPIPPPSDRNDPDAASKEGEFQTVELNSSTGASTGSDNGELWNSLDNIAAIGLAFSAGDSEVEKAKIRKRFSLDDTECFANYSLPLEAEIPFNKWMKTIQRRAGQRRKTVSGDTADTAHKTEDFDSPGTQRKSNHKKSSSGSSFGFVTAVKSASISLASFSIAPRSRRTGVSSRHHRTDRSSKASNVGRLSEDSSYLARGIVIDQAVTNRLLQRRRVLEEIISSEESYVADIKFLMNVYVTLLASIPSLSLSLRASINRNLNEIVELHEELLGDLHQVVPHSEYTQIECNDSILSPPSNGHNRWRSLDAVPEHTGGPTWLQKMPGMTAEPKVAAEVAGVFGKKMSRFFVYEEYGAKYEMMIKDVASTYRTIPQWDVYQKGLEALASSLASINNQQNGSKKSLTIGDLLPIQRVCKYPLLFAELLKQTPVCDCPDSHMAIENVLIRLREATTEINRATDDPRMKVIMEKSWLLQDRLVFPDRPDARSKSAIRSLGRIHLCGVLHASWQTKDGADGQYMICLLYRDFLLLASAPRSEQLYTVQACIALHELRVEEIDNGRDGLDAGEQAILTSLSLAIKSMGAVFGKPGTVARRLSIHRATTVGAMSGLCQVIIKNTNAFKESASSTNINRSQSLLTTNRIPVLAPARAERIRLENLLADVWTREVLPYPGMSGRARSEHLVRASASSMMRKLSVASIASNFTKRSGSIASLQKTAEDDNGPPYDNEVLRTATPIRAEQSSTDTIGMIETDDLIASRLSVIQDEKENIPKGSCETLPGLLGGTHSSSPVGTLRRMATLTVKKSWGQDGQRIITPPLRTSSANSLSQHRTVTLTTLPDMTIEEKENIPQIHTIPMAQPLQKPTKRTKAFVKSSRMVPEGIRSLFR
ncbi:hypothetical protein G7Y89_g11000 [Cudoniella acicularis]|uniref:DH domain-containing protein n=1 Tax=Cudoniella acicularis TaxID=354080 RepID=A0A8H4RBP2_9HELO|nr:hypothetical protein G7Y89_g11000 [Cudoniella acicularis]